MVFAASLLGARHLGEVVENKPASSVVVSLGKALNGTPPPLCGRQVARPGEDGFHQASQPKIRCMMNTTKTNWSSAAPQRQSPRVK